MRSDGTPLTPDSRMSFKLGAIVTSVLAIIGLTATAVKAWIPLDAHVEDTKPKEGEVPVYHLPPGFALKHGGVVGTRDLEKTIADLKRDLHALKESPIKLKGCKTSRKGSITCAVSVEREDDDR